MTEPSNNPNQKYFKLYNPIVIQAEGDIPETAYSHIYIRKAHVGDIDFILDEQEYIKLKASIPSKDTRLGMRIFERPDLDMVELYNYDINALAYISPKEMTERVRVKLSDATIL